MKLVIGSAIGLAVVVLYGGWLGYAARGGMISLVSSLVVAAGLLGLAQLSRRAVMYEFAAIVVNVLVAVYFAYRLIVTERFVPSGILLIVAFLLLFVMLLGIFLDLHRAR